MKKWTIPKSTFKGPKNAEQAIFIQSRLAIVKHLMFLSKHGLKKLVKL